MKYFILIFISCTPVREYRVIQHYKGMTVLKDLRTGGGVMIDSIIKPGIWRLDIK